MNRSFSRLSSLLGMLACGFLFVISSVVGRADDTTGTFKIGSQTAITLDGAAATADQLKTGMRAYVQPDSLQPGFALSIDAQTGKPADDKSTSKAAPTDKSKLPPAKAQNPTITSASATSITVAMQ